MRNKKPFQWNENLSGPALNIAGSNHTPLRVLAGPGTGKTFALMRRVARLLQDGVNPKRMLVCTFTRTAARDLQSEVSHLGLSGADEIASGTIHSFCFKILAKNEVFQLTGRVPRPLLDFEAKFLIGDLGKTFGGIRERETRLQAFNAAWARLQSEEPGWPQDDKDRQFENALSGWLLFHQAILIGELIPVTLNFLQNNPASSFRNAFDHVLVDEYQDLNRAEQVLLDILAEAGSLIVIGDEDQSIYSFKFAHPQGISEFDQTHRNTLDENLEECRRCPRQIVEMANALIRNNQQRINRRLLPRQENAEGEPYILQWNTIEEEAAGIASFIHQRINSRQIEPGKVLVLAPRRQFGYAIRDALNNLQVHAHSFFHEEALDDVNAQEAFTLLSLLANPEDRVSLRTWCGLGSPSLRTGAWSRLRNYCEDNGVSPFTALKDIAEGNIQIPQTTDLVNKYLELQERLATLEGITGQNLVDALFPTSEEWTAQIRSLTETIENDDFDASRLKEKLRTSITQPELPTDVDYVRIMSLHKSKGLTAGLVIVVGCIEGLIPMIKGNNNRERQACLEEQRRLFYVALTRSRNILVLSSVTKLPIDIAWRMGAQVERRSQSHARTIASRFLNELGSSRPKPVIGKSIIQ